MKVALVIPVHNRRETTLQALRSVARMSTAGFTLKTFIVDDGSTDGTSAAVAAQHPDVAIVPGDGTLHYAAGTNRGLTAALHWGADYLILANDDNVFSRDAFERLIGCARAHEKSIVGALMLRWDVPHILYQVGPFWDLWYGGWRMPRDLTVFDVPKAAWQVEGIVGNCVLVPSAAVRAHGMLDEQAFPHGWGDLQFTTRLRRAGWQLLIEPRARVFCEPNTNPAALQTIGPRRVLRVLFRDRRHPMNLARQFQARWHSAPSRIAAVISFTIYVVRFGLKGIGLGGTWPAWPDPNPADWRLPAQ